MKIIKFDKKRNYAKIRVENKLDLWHLEKMIEPRDLITAKTIRTIFVLREGKKEKAGRKQFTLTIKVEKVRYHKQKEKLRIIGKIVEGPNEVQLGSYHAIEVGVGKRLKIEKGKWKKEQIERLERARVKIGKAEIDLIKEFFIHVNKEDGLATYGVKKLKTAATIGAVKIALIPEKKIRERKTEKLARKIEDKGGKIKLVSEESDEGKKFCRQYDVAAILRFPIP